MEAPQPPRLLDQVRHVIRLKHYSLKTAKSYIHYIRDFILFHNKQHPREMGVDEIRQYLTHLAVTQHVAASTQNVALSALLFLYRQVLNDDLYSCVESWGKRRQESFRSVMAWGRSPSPNSVSYSCSSSVGKRKNPRSPIKFCSNSAQIL